MFVRYADPIDSVFTAKSRNSIDKVSINLVNDVMYLVKSNKSLITPISQSRSNFIYPV